MIIISSKDNENIKHIRKLKDKKYRDEFNEYVIEGVKIIKEAITENVEIKQIVICEECIQSEQIDKKMLYDIARFNCIYVKKAIFDLLTDVVNPQGILAVICKKEINTKVDLSQDLIVALDAVQDPGNIGTILRTLDSIGINQVILSAGSTDPYSPKVVRSTMGAIFRINIIETKNITQTLKDLKKSKFKIIATSLETEDLIYDIDYIKSVIIIGNESKGVSDETLKIADKKVKVPMFR